MLEENHPEQNDLHTSTRDSDISFWSFFEDEACNRLPFPCGQKKSHKISTFEIYIYIYIHKI